MGALCVTAAPTRSACLSQGRVAKRLTLSNESPALCTAVALERTVSGRIAVSASKLAQEATATAKDVGANKEGAAKAEAAEAAQAVPPPLMECILPREPYEISGTPPPRLPVLVLRLPHAADPGSLQI